MRTNVEKIEIPSGPVKVVRADGYEVESLTSKGWNVVATYVGTGEITYSVPSRRPDAASYERDPVSKLGAVRFLVLAKDTASALAEASEQVAKATRDLAAATTRAKESDASAAKHAKTAEEQRERADTLSARLTGYTEKATRYEVAIAKLRREYGDRQIDAVLADAVIGEVKS
jgi:hypothetical protein